jgi:hypothetical protein
MTMINNGTPEANKKALDEYLGRVSRKHEEAEWKTIKNENQRNQELLFVNIPLVHFNIQKFQ